MVAARRLALLALAITGCAAPETEPPAPDVPAVAPPSAPPEVLRTHRAAPPRDPVAPFALTASDGTGLALTALAAKAVLEGPLGFTELHLRFHNPEARVREGTFAITLPARAAVSRFAVLEAGRTKEAEVVPVALARRAYDDELHRGIDPAILEAGAGNQFTARVFPIPASGDAELIVSYSQELAASGYVLPLVGLPTIDRVTVALDAVQADGTHQTARLDEARWQPDHDFVADVATPAAIASGPLVAAAFEVAPASPAAADPPADLALLVDTSASRAPGFPRYVGRVRTLVGELAARYPDLQIEVVAFDQETRSLFTGAARDFGEAEVAAVLARRAAGASDLGQALTQPRHAARVAIITDGMVTAGATDAALAAGLARRAPERVDVILAGGVRDERVARTLARAGARPGDVFDLDDAILPIAEGLGEVVRVDVPITVAGATWVHPRTLPSLRPGAQVTVFARLPDAPTAVTVTLGGDTRTLAAIPATPALLERATARVEIDELEDELARTTAAAPARALRKAIEARSVAARVASTQAAMLVLDTDDEYARYGIDRAALADILEVGPDGLELAHRTFVALGRAGRGGAAPLSRAEALARARGVTSRGDGSWFAGGRAGARMATHIAAVPTVSIGQPLAVGSLDKSIIRRYLQRSTPRIRACYERELLARPQLHGTIATEFTIAPTGHVMHAAATGFDDAVAACVAAVIAQIEFPAGSETNIVVHYPFAFRSANTPEEVDPVAAALAAPAPGLVPSGMVPAAPDGAAPSADTAPPAPEAVAPDVVPAAPVGAVDATPSAPAPAPAAPAARTGDGFVFGPPASVLDGKLASVMRAVARGDAAQARALATSWADAAPTDVLALVGLGEAYEASGDRAAAARAYGSIIDLYPTRADLRRFAGERLERLGPSARRLAIDTYRRAVADRPDQITGHRLLAYALLRAGDPAGAFAAILTGADQKLPEGRFAGAARVLARDAGMIGAVYVAHGGDRERVTAALARRGLTLVTEPATRVILYWETDANDVDLHVRDAAGGHAYYAHRELETGGELYADITTGFGPECFEFQGAPTAGPYELGVHYYAQGAMGYGMGLLQIARFDGAAFTFDDRPYVITRNQAYLALGRLP